MHCCRLVNVIKNKKHKKQPWGNVECFAFGGVTVRFASLETSFHAANHTIPPPPSHEGYPHYPKDKNRSPFHGEKPLKKCVLSAEGYVSISQNEISWEMIYKLSRKRCDEIPLGI